MEKSYEMHLTMSYWIRRTLWTLCWTLTGNFQEMPMVRPESTTESPSKTPFNRPHQGVETIDGGESRCGPPLRKKKSRRWRADAQRIVTTRLLYRLHDPTAQPSRMQGIYPRARWNCNASANPRELLPGGRCRPAEIQGRSLFVSDYDVRGRIAAFWHGFWLRGVQP